MIHRRHRQEAVVRSEAAEFRRADQPDQHPRSVRQDHALGLAGRARRIGDGPRVRLVDPRALCGLCRVGDQRLIIGPELDQRVASAVFTQRLFDQRARIRIDEDHPRSAIVERLANLDRRQSRVDCRQRRPRVRNPRHHLDIFGAVARHDRHDVALAHPQCNDCRIAQPPRPVGQHRRAHFVRAELDRHFVRIARRIGPERSPQRHRMKGCRKGHRGNLVNTASALSRIIFCWLAGRRPSSATSATARSGSITGQSVPNSTLWLP